MAYPIQHRCKPLPDDREQAVVEVLRRIYEGDFGTPPKSLATAFDSGVIVESIDEEIAAFIRKFGPFTNSLRYLPLDIHRNHFRK